MCDVHIREVFVRQWRAVRFTAPSSMNIKVIAPPDDVDKAEQIVSDACDSVNSCSSSPRTSGGDWVDRLRDGSHFKVICRADFKIMCLLLFFSVPSGQRSKASCGADLKTLCLTSFKISLSGQRSPATVESMSFLRVEAVGKECTSFAFLFSVPRLDEDSLAFPIPFRWFLSILNSRAHQGVLWTFLLLLTALRNWLPCSWNLPCLKKIQFKHTDHEKVDEATGSVESEIQREECRV